jgi:nicotinic acid mononucleotide adenylyltransferase
MQFFRRASRPPARLGVFPGASFAERVEILSAALADAPAFSLASTAGGLFAEIAAECRQAYGDAVSLSFLCGGDAAERIANWDYGQPEAFAGMLRDFDLLVAARGGEYRPPPPLQASVRCLELAGEFDDVSATEVRRRIADGEPWERLAPAAVLETIGRIYRPR